MEWIGLRESLRETLFIFATNHSGVVQTSLNQSWDVHTLDLPQSSHDSAVLV